MNLTKFEYKHHEMLQTFLSAPRTVPNLFCNHITWLARGHFYFERIADMLFIYKKSQIFGNPIFYHMGFPLHKYANKQFELDATLYLLNTGTDISISEEQIKYLEINLDEYQKDKTPPEYIYSSEDYATLDGGKWKKWRYAILQAQKDCTIRIHPTGVALPAMVKRDMKLIVDKWKSYKDKYVSRFATWYASDVNKLQDAAVMIFYHNGEPVYFNVTQLYGNTVSILDIKTTRDGLDNSSSISKAAHVFIRGYWSKILKEQPFHIISGCGDKSYEHDGKSFDLDKNKTLLRPSVITPIYKVRANKQT
jgi:hypothetical protein